MDSTIGDLYIDSIFECYTLEDLVREEAGRPVHEWKIPGKTAIPSGRYQIVIDFSPKFQKPLMHLLNVEGFSGVRVHAGNTEKDTDGCILVGRAVNGTAITASRSALEAMQIKVQNALDAGEDVFITIVNYGEFSWRNLLRLF